MKGYRTILFNGVIAVGTALLTYVAGVKWTDVVDPTVGLLIVTGANFGLRFLSNTPALKAE